MYSSNTESLGLHKWYPSLLSMKKSSMKVYNLQFFPYVAFEGWSFKIKRIKNGRDGLVKISLKWSQEKLLHKKNQTTIWLSSWIILYNRIKSKCAQGGSTARRQSVGLSAIIIQLLRDDTRLLIRGIGIACMFVFCGFQAYLKIYLHFQLSLSVSVITINFEAYSSIIS